MSLLWIPTHCERLPEWGSAPTMGFELLQVLGPRLFMCQSHCLEVQPRHHCRPRHAGHCQCSHQKRLSSNFKCYHKESFQHSSPGLSHRRPFQTVQLSSLCAHNAGARITTYDNGPHFLRWTRTLKMVSSPTVPNPHDCNSVQLSKQMSKNNQAGCGEAPTRNHIVRSSVTSVLNILRRWKRST